MHYVPLDCAAGAGKFEARVPNMCFTQKRPALPCGRAGLFSISLRYFFLKGITGPEFGGASGGLSGGGGGPTSWGGASCTGGAVTM